MHWNESKPHLNYGPWLYRAYEGRFYDSNKILFIRLRNRALKRRLVATYDDQKFYNRYNFSNVIQQDKNYSLKYLLALFNSSLLNFWSARQYPDVEVSIADVRQLPIYPADADTQASFVTLVDDILAKNAELNRLRAEGHAIRPRGDGAHIDVPYGTLLADLQRSGAEFAVMPLFDARAVGLFSISDRCDMDAQVSSHVFIPDRHPQSVVLRNNKLWLDVPDDARRRYLRGYLGQPQWRGKTWDDLKNQALVPADTAALATFFAAEAEQIAHIQALLNDVARIDAEIDTKVLDLYGIHDEADRRRILGSAPPVEDETVGEDGDDETESEPEEQLRYQ